MMMHDLFLRRPAVVLRRSQPQDAVAWLALGNDVEIMRMFGADATDWPPLIAAGAARWTEELATHPHAWVVEHERRFLGEARLDGLNPHDACARLAVGLYDPAKLRIGLGREAIRLVLAHAHAHVVPMHEKTDITSRRYVAEQHLTFRPLPVVSREELSSTASVCV